MGRKKRKTVVEDPAIAEAQAIPKQEDLPPDEGPVDDAANSEPNPEDKDGEGKSSKYAMTSHSGEIVREDIYISDGSEDEEEDVDVVLAASRSGMMRRGLTTPAAMIQPNRQWVRQDKDEVDKEAEDKQREEELAQLDPVQRAARLQEEKARLEEQEKEEERVKESQENAGRDPTMFSKRTAFDIRFDQMEDKPWLRASDISDFFNYGLDEEGWLEYSQQQLMIRQELTDAARNKRGPDPNIVPVTPRAPSSQAPRVAVAGQTSTKEEDMEDDDDKEQEETNAPVGPSLPESGVVPKNEGSSSSRDATLDAADDIDAGIGGAWGAAVPGSHLAKLIEEQEQREKQPEQSNTSRSNANHLGDRDSGSSGGGGSGRNGGGGGYGTSGGGGDGEHASYYSSGGQEANHHYGSKYQNDQYGRADSTHGYNGPSDSDEYRRYNQSNDYYGSSSHNDHYGSSSSGKYGGAGESYSHEAMNTGNEPPSRGQYSGGGGSGGYYEHGGSGQWSSSAGEDQYGGGSYDNHNNRRGQHGGRGRYGGGGGGYNNNNSWDHNSREDYGRKRQREWRR